MSSLGRSVIVVACLAVASRAAAVAPEIKDGGKFFSAEAVKKANQIIHDIAVKTGQDLLIETFATVPGDDAEKVKNMSKEERSDYFKKWVLKRAEATVVNGVYILVCKDPQHVSFAYTKKAKSTFDTKARAALRAEVLGKFNDKQYDEGLLAGANFVQATLATGKAPLGQGVKDGARFFSADAVKKANEIIAEIAGKYKKNLLIETFTTVPGDADEVARVKKMSKEDRYDYFRKWATKRIEVTGANGVYVLVCKSPGFVKIEVSKNVRSTFDTKAVGRLQKAMLDEFGDKRFDEGLLAGVKVVRDTFAAGN